MKSILLLLIFLVSTPVSGQKHSTFYSQYCCSHNMTIDTVRVVKYVVRNTVNKKLAIFFSKTDVRKDTNERILGRILYQRFNDFKMADFACEEIVDCSNFIFFPEMFVKFVDSSECFEIILHSKNKTCENLEEFIEQHLFVCEVDVIEKICTGFVNGVKKRNADYSYGTIVIDYEDISVYNK